MRRVPRLLALVACVFASGCATRGAMTFRCMDLNPEAVDYSAVAQSVVKDQGWGYPGGVPPGLDGDAAAPPVRSSGAEAGLCPGGDVFERNLLFRRGICGDESGLFATSDGAVLALSGGGQWGAFGAGFLKGLASRPHYDTITGISTGSMQALILGDPGDKSAKYETLFQAYDGIDEEGVIVDRQPRVMAVFSGSIAGLQPLVTYIHKYLCTNTEIAKVSKWGDAGCLLERLGRKRTDRPIDTTVAFVQADTGLLMWADVNALAALARSKTLDFEELGERYRNEPEVDAGNNVHLALLYARECVTSTVVASSAMPAWYQQVKIEYGGEDNKPTTRTFYDGGVRQGVFLPAVAEKAARVAAHLEKTKRDAHEPATALYVIRNGPTKGKLDPAANDTQDVLTTALRSYDIVVNQLELGSLEALRTHIPCAPIALATADGRETDIKLSERLTDKKRKQMMFDPAFIDDLLQIGQLKADREQPWLQVATPPGACCKKKCP